MRAELAAAAAVPAAGTSRQRGEISKQLGRWQVDPALAGLRDETSLSALPEAERGTLRKFWSDVEALKQKATATVVADPHNRS